MRIMPSLAARAGVLLAAFTLFTPQLGTSQTFGGVGERAQGMAGAFVAVADDASAVYWNPAGLGWPTGSIFDAQFGVANETIFFAAALPSLGLSYYRLPTVSASERRQNEGSGKVPIRSFVTSNVGVTINQTVVNGLLIGSTIRLVRGGFERQPGQTTFDIDAGVMYSVARFRAGLTARNLRRPRFDGEFGSFSLDRQVRAGVAIVPRSLPTGVHGPFTLAFDADLTRNSGLAGDRRDASVGGEYWLAQGRIGARTGLRCSTLDASDRGVSGGLTLRMPHSAFVEGHLTKDSTSTVTAWGFGARVTF
jgi:F plasmid transfer operon, TraF, protein